MVAAALGEHRALVLTELENGGSAREGVRNVVLRHLAWIGGDRRMAMLLLGAVPGALLDVLTGSAVAQQQQFSAQVQAWLHRSGWSGDPDLLVMNSVRSGPADDFARGWLTTGQPHPTNATVSVLADASLAPATPSSGRPHRLHHHAGVADLEQVRHRIGAERVVLIGHSYGAYLAAPYIAEHPDRVERAVFLSPRGLEDRASATAWTGVRRPLTSTRSSRASSSTSTVPATTSTSTGRSGWWRPSATSSAAGPCPGLSPRRISHRPATSPDAPPAARKGNPVEHAASSAGPVAGDLRPPECARPGRGPHRQPGAERPRGCRKCAGARRRCRGVIARDAPDGSLDEEVTTMNAVAGRAAVTSSRAGTGIRLRAAVIALAAATAVAALAPTARADGGAPPAFVYSSDRDGDSEIYLRQADGRERQLTRNDASDFGAVWSPDGRHLAFVSDRDGDEDIYVMRTDGSGVRQLTRNGAAADGRPVGDFSPAWSPDGRRIAFASDRSGGAPEIWLMRWDGRRQQQLTTTADFVTDTTPTWSPDGGSIAFVSDRAGNDTADVYVMRSDGSGVGPVTPTDDEFDSTVPDWSPDGQLIAYSSNQNAGQQDIWAVDPDTGERRFLGGDAAYDDVAPRWTADGGQVVYWTFPYFEERSGDVWVMAADGSGRQTVVDFPAEDFSPDPRPER